MKTIIAGSRGYENWAAIKSILDRSPWTITEVVCGECRGPDLLGKQWANEKKIGLRSFPADWNTHNRKAGMLRNTEMAKYAQACIVFWDGKSPGSKHMIDLALAHKLHLLVVQV